MRNHFHLALETPEPNLSDGMKWLQCAALWEERIQVVATECGVDLRHLPSLKSADEKLRVAAVMKRNTSVSNRWLAARLQMGSLTSVAPLIHRFHQSGEADTPAFRLLLSRFSV
jgi:hypothetical protein